MHPVGHSHQAPPAEPIMITLCESPLADAGLHRFGQVCAGLCKPGLEVCNCRKIQAWAHEGPWLLGPRALHHDSRPPSLANYDHLFVNSRFQMQACTGMGPSRALFPGPCTVPCTRPRKRLCTWCRTGPCAGQVPVHGPVHGHRIRLCVSLASRS